MSTQGFDSLPKWTRTRIVQAILDKQKTAAKKVDEMDSKSSSSSKRKRPESFMESDFKRVEVEKGTPASDQPWQVGERPFHDLELQFWKCTMSAQYV